LSPSLHPVKSDEEGLEELDFYREDTPIRERSYDKKIPGFTFEGEDIKLDSKKFNTEF